MTNERAIRALVDAAGQWADMDCSSQFGSGYRNAMRDVLNTLSHCPTGAAAIRGDGDPLECRKKARRTVKHAASVQVPKKQLPTRNRPQRR